MKHTKCSQINYNINSMFPKQAIEWSAGIEEMRDIRYPYLLVLLHKHTSNAKGLKLLAAKLVAGN